MNTAWTATGIVVGCLVLAVLVWRLRRANRTVDRILAEERAETERAARHPEPTATDHDDRPVTQQRHGGRGEPR